ncbi:MAG: VWA domain-containing protein [Caulobacteraceae bacterium]|nr:VWA domain-containing protein [Caulobacteraceae bacterium]
MAKPHRYYPRGIGNTPYVSANEFSKWLNTNYPDEHYQPWLSFWDMERLGISQDEQNRLMAENELILEKYRGEFNEWQLIKLGRENAELVLRNNTLDSFITVFQKADRILTGMPILFQFTEDKSQPIAWSDGKSITFNGSLIKEIDEKTVCSLHGLNYHEVAHILFSARAGTKLGKAILNDPRSEELRQAFNLLEDNRAEYLLGLKYPSVRPFLTTSVLEYVADRPHKLGHNWVLLAGRKYLSVELRQLSARMSINLIGESKTAEVYDLVNEYCRLLFPSQYDRALEILNRIVDILDLEKVDKGGCGSRPMYRNGRPMTEKEIEELLKSDPDYFNGKDKFGNWLGNGEGNPNGEGNENSNEPDKSDTKRSWGRNKGKGDGVGNSNWVAPTDSAIKERVEKLIEETKSDKSLQDKVRRTIKSVYRERQNKAVIDKASVARETLKPTKSDVLVVKRFSQELERLRIENDPAWLRETPTGKLNVNRAMTTDVNRIDKLFDRWYEGNDICDMETVILVDSSGSMWHEVGSAYRSAWIIKRAIEKIEGKVTVIDFNTLGSVVSSSSDKAKATQVPWVKANGGTEPETALLETKRILTLSKSKTKLVFMLTDGAFNNGVEDTLISEIRELGSYFSLCLIASEWFMRSIADMSPEERLAMEHGANSFHLINQPLDLVDVARKIVKHQLNPRKK